MLELTYCDAGLSEHEIKSLLSVFENVQVSFILLCLIENVMECYFTVPTLKLFLTNCSLQLFLCVCI